MRTSDAEHTLALWAEVHERIPGLEVDLPLLLRMAQALAEAGQREQAAATLRKALLVAGASPGATLAQRGLDPDSRARAEQLMARLRLAASGAAPSSIDSLEPLKLS